MLKVTATIEPYAVRRAVALEMMDDSYRRKVKGELLFPDERSRRDCFRLLHDRTFAVADVTRTSTVSLKWHIVGGHDSSDQHLHLYIPWGRMKMLKEDISSKE